MASNSIASLDSCVLLRIILHDNLEQFEKAVDLVDDTHSTYKISDAVLSEVVFVMTRMKIDRETIVAALTRIISRPNIRTGSIVDAELFYTYINHPKLSFTDCYLAIESAQNKANPLWTFDQALARQVSNAQLVE